MPKSEKTSKVSRLSIILCNTRWANGSLQRRPGLQMYWGLACKSLQHWKTRIFHIKIQIADSLSEMGSPGNVGALGLRSGPAASGTESLPPGTTEHMISMCHGSPQACPLIPKMGLAPRSICIWDLPWRGRTEQSHRKDPSYVSLPPTAHLRSEKALFLFIFPTPRVKSWT